MHKQPACPVVVLFLLPERLVRKHEDAIEDDAETLWTADSDLSGEHSTR